MTLYMDRPTLATDVRDVLVEIQANCHVALVEAERGRLKEMEGRLVEMGRLVDVLKAAAEKKRARA